MNGGSAEPKQTRVNRSLIHSDFEAFSGVLAMNPRSTLFLLLASALPAAQAQTAAKPTGTTHSATSAHTATHTAGSTEKLPPDIPPASGPVKTAFSLRYQDIKIGDGPVAEPRKVYRVRYTGWLASSGQKFDSSNDHPAEPVFDKDLKRVMGPDGKPKMEPGQPLLFLQGRPGMIPGFDLGFDGMRVGGKRRLFIPYQMAYGTTGRPSNDPAHPGIPPKADLIFDIELLDTMDVPEMPGHPGMGGAPGGAPQAPGAHPATPPPTSSQPAPPPSGEAAPQPPSSPQPEPK